MTKRKLLLLIPLAIIAGFLIYTWTNILFMGFDSNWRHYVALGLFVLLIYLYFKSFKKAILATGLYLLIGTCNLLTLTPSVTTDSYGIRIASLEIATPMFQLLSFGILVLYSILNFDTLVDIYLDYKEAKKAKQKK